MRKRSLTVGTKKGVNDPDAPIEHKKEPPQIDHPLVVTPGLRGAVHDFEAHWAVSDKEPVLILGETGVGKSLFLHIAKQLFKLEHGGDEKKLPIVEANCGHFSGKQSDLNMTRSELFGHVKGSSNLAYKDKVGLVEKADGGLLILEEVGELPSEAQALLLTFIETGEYRRVGDERTRKANAKIVGATNREDALREDFKYRFFPYYIQSLRERKQDILYYFNEIFPELAKTLNKSEVLVLLCHHWPGNVREVERVGRLLLRRRWRPEKMGPEGADKEWKPVPPGEYGDFGLYHLNQKDTVFDPDVLFALRNDLRGFDADVDLLESLLMPLRVSLDDQRPTPAFQEIAEPGNSVFFSFFDDRLGVKVCEDFPLFEEAFKGYRVFCGLFLQDSVKNKKILESLKTCDIRNFSLDQVEHAAAAKRSVKKLAMAVMAYLKDFNVEGYKLPGNPHEFWRVISELKEETETEDTCQKFENEEFMNLVCGMHERDLLKNYYLGLIKKSAGNVKAASTAAGLKETTFRSKLDKLGIKYKRTGRSS
jgi:DNA-binding NtrC family response regulator